MHRIDGDAHVNNRFMSEDAATGTAATEVTSDWLNSIQDELAALAEVGGQALDKANNAQVLAAVQWLIANGGTDFLTTIRGGVAEDKDTLKKIVDWAAPLASPALTGTPTAPTASLATNTTQVATTAFVAAALANMVDSAPGALDTLNELASALGDDPNFAATINAQIALKLAKADVANNLTTTVSGKALDARQGVALEAAKLDKTAQAADSAKLNGQIASYYATKSEVDAKLLKDHIPVGLIAMWSGTQVPSGWTLCNGIAKTDRDGGVYTPPNLSDRFILATTDLSKVKDTGGSSTTSSNGEHSHDMSGLTIGATTLTEGQMPSHGHSNGRGVAGTSGSAGGSLRDGRDFVDKNKGLSYTGGSESHTHSVSGDSTDNAGAHTHTHTPPYYKLAFIAYIGA